MNDKWNELKFFLSDKTWLFILPTPTHTLTQSKNALSPNREEKPVFSCLFCFYSHSPPQKKIGLSITKPIYCLIF